MKSYQKATSLFSAESSSRVWSLVGPSYMVLLMVGWGMKWETGLVLKISFLGQTQARGL